MKDLVLPEIFRRVGSQNALAKKLGITRQAVCAWEKVPMRWIKTISEMTGIPRKLIRPDIYGD